jgi:FkbM family methyltransferase
MSSTLYNIFYYMIDRIWGLINPRAILWRYIKKRYPNKPIITKLGKDLKVRIYTHDVIGKEIYANGMFEQAESKFVTKFLKPGMVFFDVGANLGQYTLLAAQCVGTSGQVHSFEPNSRMFAELKYNVELNGFSRICTLNNIAILNNEGTARLSVYEPGAEVYASLGTQHRGKTPIIGHESVDTITLDTYIGEKGIDHVDLIKMDIEGAELFALKGAVELLSREDGPVILLELADINTIGFGYKAVETWNYLESHGYGIFSFGAHGDVREKLKRPSLDAITMNVIAIKE